MTNMRRVAPRSGERTPILLINGSPLESLGCIRPSFFRVDAICANDTIKSTAAQSEQAARHGARYGRDRTPHRTHARATDSERCARIERERIAQCMATAAQIPLIVQSRGRSARIVCDIASA
ncbi:hypothetical protein KTD18_03280 [Burkholderia multivorans]|uniref:hypothetical protein n=1 Tax=Burkholderia multivorans TaxID=87883 RepID=UPI0013A07DE0|nr:hypothetical protein [Burkholderia multivorans]MBU9290554.1 hypothetical protein [Burkholderia multivorans]